MHCKSETEIPVFLRLWVPVQVSLVVGLHFIYQGSVTLKMSELLALKQVLLRGFFVNSGCPCENKRMIL